MVTLLERRLIKPPFLPDRTEYVLPDQRVWIPARDQPVPIEQVEAALTSYFNRFPITAAYTDPWQMENTIQRFDGLIVAFLPGQVPRSPRRCTTW